eukprot:6178775-Pleurochrysis_carterae.AAC.4
MQLLANFTSRPCRNRSHTCVQVLVNSTLGRRRCACRVLDHPLAIVAQPNLQHRSFQHNISTIRYGMERKFIWRQQLASSTPSLSRKELWLVSRFVQGRCLAWSLAPRGSIAVCASRWELRPVWAALRFGGNSGSAVGA